ncbi:iron citrate ABC transporter substrate-binding protein [Staphylococcus auricularis]|uniref:Iron citrate ABC transporter substrate-binding protein n=1 Tax=Staphylococcus auricularis TaxID=29379 RepID=A0AAP8TT60_9STAP|nr:ABC transporter substrate-binding protein [Staphylococcus auricularis]PNZ67611.1 iron citrate ABC transporter substrate-binding protein [Staphylococcus auricularis]QPT05476.1 ABC transporter substrate-binding protein [Staphylococcus auricularis]BCU52136.1 iron citrate ABC transporter substrate-binding protein [Staphylococcus auricularis]SQJ10582.1 ferrichrome ABC transporter [Staphylococcus auricularis]
MTIEIKHNAGKAVIPDDVETVVALEYSFVDALVELDMEVAGIADDGDRNNLIQPLRDHVGDYKSVGSRLEPDLDKIKEVQPQLIIADENRHSEIYDQLEEIAPTLLLRSFNADYNENIDVFRIIGYAVSKESEAQKRLEQHEETMKANNDKITIDKSIETLPAVVSERGVTAHGLKSYMSSLLDVLDFKLSLTQELEESVPEYMNGDYLEFTYDQLAELNPQRLILMVADENEDSVQSLKDSDIWHNLDAVKNNRVHFTDRELWAKSRGLISTEQLVDDMSNLSE